MPKIKKQPPRAKALTSVQKRYLCNILTFLFLHSEPFRLDLEQKFNPPRRHNRVLKRISRAVHDSWSDLAYGIDRFEESVLFHRSLAVFGVVSLVVLAQVMYPSDRALPLSRLNAHGYVGFSSQNDILKKFEDFDSRTVTVHTHTKSFTTSYRDLGVTLKPSETIDSVTSYSLRQKLIPFSIFFVGNRSHQAVRELNDAQLSLFVQDVIAQRDKLPVDAIVTREGTKLSVKPSEDGYAYQFSELRSQMMRSDLRNKAQIVFAPTILPPSLNTTVATMAVDRMQARINNPIMVSGDGKIMKIEPEVIAEWVDIVLKPEQKTVELTLNKKRVADTLRPFAVLVDSAPIPTVSTLLNGLPAGMKEGVVGKSLQFDDLVDRVATAPPATSSIEANVLIIPPSEVKDRRYSKDNMGLQTLLTYYTQTNRGDYSIDIRSLNGLNATFNPHRIYPSVGIFRAYLAHTVYGAISAGALTEGSATSTGLNVRQCLDNMIRDLDESCTNALGTIVGWGVNDSLLRAQGFESTTLTQGAGLTSANDTSDWMIKLLDRQISSSYQTNALVGMMQSHANRSGIPAGIDNAVVANLAGDYGRFRHDMAIVYHPNGTYVISILSEGASSAQLAELAREVNKVMNQ